MQTFCFVNLSICIYNLSILSYLWCFYAVWQERHLCVILTFYFEQNVRQSTQEEQQQYGRQNISGNKWKIIITGEEHQQLNRIFNDRTVYTQLLCGEATADVQENMIWSIFFQKSQWLFDWRRSESSTMGLEKSILRAFWNAGSVEFLMKKKKKKTIWRKPVIQNLSVTNIAVLIMYVSERLKLVAHQKREVARLIFCNLKI